MSEQNFLPILYVDTCDLADAIRLLGEGDSTTCHVMKHPTSADFMDYTPMVNLSEFQAALAEKDRFIKEIQATLELSVDAVLNSKKIADEKAAELDGAEQRLAEYMIAWNEINAKLAQARKAAYHSDCACEDCNNFMNENLDANGLLKSPAKSEGKDGIGWCPNSIDDNPAEDTWRKK